MIIYLYVKQHAITGLKYFGKTSRANPYKYKGSGTYWKRHIKKYGIEHVITINVWQFDSIEQCSNFAINFSKQNNIVRSTEWANLCEENGHSGGDTGNKKASSRGGRYIRSEETKIKNSKSMLGRRFTDEHRLKLSQSRPDISGTKNPMYGKKRPGRKWYNNGIKQILVLENSQPPGYVPGML